ncbi:MAG: nucleoside hydrolase [Candidatus Puniceispirillum sp.]|uniref:nucleoside hydrolase n=1 Tax=Candidatus Puniceispirillum sp. TaxID=2026719 RepID=UPI001ED1D0A8|nr:nucleoside hydrolase [Candidatus Puniceispirillum sp.]MBT6415777.1 nucleoside hydrolase [Candidatus Puniceispirillum sp.]
MPQKIIIDTDPGIDDAMAIHMAFADPRLDVLGLTTIFGNVTIDIATRNALVLAEMAHYKTAIIKGAPIPRRRPLEPPADFVHGAEGFGDVPPITPQGTPVAEDAARYLCETCAAHPGEIIICAVGPLTNLAAALDYDPAIVDHVKAVVIMGGSAAPHGNVTAVAEANIWNDPDAAECVFAARWPVTMVGLDVTEKAQCMPADFAALARQSPDIGGFLNAATQFYFDFHENKTGIRSCFMHDPSAVLAITDPEYFDFESMALTVICDGDDIGRTLPVDDASRPMVQVAMQVNASAVQGKFTQLVAQADKLKANRATDAQR